ncbi:MAG: hypothetical protein MUF31_08995 [Akkermansiaceae bacterium]|jgi:hypothetical protein|nr:hypothetical protein [Akkermansiaceae bacterium]
MQDDPRESYLDAAVARSGADAEQALHLRSSLENLLPEDIRHEELATASRILKKRPSKALWHLGLVLVFLLSSSMGLRLLSPGLSAYLAKFSLVPVGMTPKIGNAWSTPMSDEDRLWCFGDVTMKSEVDRWRPVWENHPDQPALMIHRILVTEEETSRAFIEDIREIGRKVDPDNGWFALREAMRDSKRVAELDEIPRRDREAGIAQAVTLLDAAELHRRIELFHEAAASSFISTRQNELLASRVAKLGPAKTSIDQIQAIVLSSTQKWDWNLFPFAGLVAAEAQRCVAENDAEALRRLLDSWEKVMSHQLNDAPGLIENLILMQYARISLAHLRDASAAMRMDAEKWQKREKAVRNLSQERRDRLDNTGLSELLLRHGSMLASLHLPSLERTSGTRLSCTAADLEPGCRVDHAILSRLASLAVWLLLGMAVLIRLCGSRTRRILAGNSLPWTRADFGLVVLFGVFLPLLAWWAFRSFTPWGRLDINPWRSAFIGPISQTIGLFVLLCVSPLAVAAWRLGRSARVIGFAPRPRVLVAMLLLPWLGLFTAAAALPISPASLVLAGLALVFFAAALILGFFLFRRSSGDREGARWRRAALGKVMRPAWLAGMAALAPLLPWFEYEERHWIPRDTLFQLTPAGLKSEAEVTAIMTREFTDLLDLSSSF